ncbi:BnaC08g11430D [Brassica napus]|uniref:BnaC08g11430D protein n=1 Tax=Brassica napus TaxID=3708 RepID=A0A078FAQ1_BRANA|nr:BnaC08g11430D [Brassica napus]
MASSAAQIHKLPRRLQIRCRSGACS